MRILLRLFLRLFPDEVDGILRSEMEETFWDGYHASGSRSRFLVREMWSFFKTGVRERVFRRKRSGLDSGGGFSPIGAGGPSGGVPGFGGRFGLLATLKDDLSLALKKVKKSPGFTSATALVLAMGIGATVAMFSILDAALLRSLPYPDPHELVLGSATFDGAWNITCSFPDYEDHRDSSDAFQVMAAMMPGLHSYTVTGGDAPQRAGVHWVTHDFFEAIQITPALGRGFSPEDGERGASDVAVISFGFWQRWFGGDPDVLGQTSWWRALRLRW